MKKEKLVLFFFLFFSLLIFKASADFSLTDSEVTKIENNGYIISEKYSSLQLCSDKKNENDLKYPDFERSTCFQNSDNYFYFICGDGNSCDLSVISEKANVSTTSISNSEISTNNPYSEGISDQLLEKLNNLINTIKGKGEGLTKEKYEELLDSFIQKLNRLKNKYSENKQIQQIIKYLDFEINLIKDSLKTSDVDQFFCELLGNCGEESIDGGSNTGVEVGPGTGGATLCGIQGCEDNIQKVQFGGNAYANGSDVTMVIHTKIPKNSIQFCLSTGSCSKLDSSWKNYYIFGINEVAGYQTTLKGVPAGDYSGYFKYTNEQGEEIKSNAMSVTVKEPTYTSCTSGGCDNILFRGEARVSNKDDITIVINTKLEKNKINFCLTGGKCVGLDSGWKAFYVNGKPGGFKAVLYNIPKGTYSGYFKFSNGGTDRKSNTMSVTVSG